VEHHPVACPRAGPDRSPDRSPDPSPDSSRGPWPGLHLGRSVRGRGSDVPSGIPFAAGVTGNMGLAKLARVAPLRAMGKQASPGTTGDKRRGPSSLSFAALVLGGRRRQPVVSGRAQPARSSRGPARPPPPFPARERQRGGGRTCMRVPAFSSTTVSLSLPFCRARRVPRRAQVDALGGARSGHTPTQWRIPSSRRSTGSPMPRRSRRKPPRVLESRARRLRSQPPPFPGAPGSREWCPLSLSRRNRTP